MDFNKYIKYSIRFLFLQSLLTYLVTLYFDRFLIPKIDIYQNQPGFTFRNQIDVNLLEDAQRFFPWVNETFIKIDTSIAFFIFIFLIFLYSTKFYTYVNELSFSLDRSYIDEYFSIYLVWTSSLMVFVTLFRFSNLISRGYLVLLTFLIPFVLLVFRNSEFLSSLLGRSVTNENYLTFNLKDDSIFRKDWASKLVSLHDVHSFVQNGHGDQFHSYLPEAVRRIGLWDERFCGLSRQAADYFWRCVMYNIEGSTIQDTIHRRIINPIFPNDVEKSRGWLVNPDVRQIDGVHDNTANHQGEISEKLMSIKYPFEPFPWTIEKISRRPKRTVIDNFITYPYFEKDIYNLREKGYII